MKRALLLAVALAAPFALAACASAASPAAPPPSPTLTSSPSPAATAAQATARPAAPACKLKIRFDYIVRSAEAGTPAIAQLIGNVDLGNCTPTLKDFARTAGQGPGECTTIARARANPGYDVNAVPAPPLRRVLASAGPGC